MPASWYLGLALLALPLAAAAAEPIRVTGRVLAMDGESGKAGARVELFPAYEDHAAALRRLNEKVEPAPLATARSGADGSFEIAAPESGGFRVMVQAKGHLPMEIPFLLLTEDADLPETYLPPGQPLEVRTVGPDGQPLAGIEVRLSDPQSRWRGERDEDPSNWRIAERRGISGDEGRLTLPVFAQESPELTATSAAFLGQTMQSPPSSSAIPLSRACSPRSA